MRILVINPGSTSTKLAVYDENGALWRESISHPATELAQFHHINEQYDYRKRHVRETLAKAGMTDGFDAVVARGGLLRPTPGGVYRIDGRIKHDLWHADMEHASNLAAWIADEIAAGTGCPAYIADPVVTDEMADVGMHVKVRSPRHIEEIAKKAKVSVDYAQEQVNKLADCGIVRCIYDGDVETYYYPIWVPGIMEGMLSVKSQVEKYPVIAECFERYTRYRTPILVPNFPVGMGPMRVMPVGSAITFFSGEVAVASYSNGSTASVPLAFRTRT